jgi:putative N-acetylmannosamine-6-phosphate epimerase
MSPVGNAPATSRGADLIKGLKGGLIISVQQEESSPLGDSATIAAMAKTVASSGCVALRINSPANIRAVSAAVDLPIIGIYKIYPEQGRLWITPSFETAQLCVEAGASIVALDTTDRPRKKGESIEELVKRVHGELDVPVMADISNYEEGILAARAGADLVATTLSGYTQPPLASPFDPPDVELVRKLASSLTVPVIAEGRYNSPELASQAIRAGAHAVVVGSAITRPDILTRLFVRSLKRG